MFYSDRPMSNPRADVDAAVAGLRARWGAAAPQVIGSLALAPAPVVAPLPEVGPWTDPRPDLDDRVIHTGFAALDAILGPGGLPRNASVAIRGDGSSGRTTLVLRLAAEAQAAGFDRGLARPVAQLRPGRGGRPWCPARMARGHHPGDARRGPRHRWRAAGRALGRPARPRPARWPAGRRRTVRPVSPTGSAGWRRSPGARRRSSSCSNRPVTPAA